VLSLANRDHITVIISMVSTPCSLCHWCCADRTVRS